MPTAPLRPCNTCGRLHRGGCPQHPPPSRQYRPNRPSVTTATYDDAYLEARAIVLEADDHTCVYCNNPATTTDHIIPASRGGTGTTDNLAAACRTCNESKGNRTPLEWLASGCAPPQARTRIWNNPRFTQGAPR